MIRADTRQQSQAFWGLATFLLNGAPFVLIGLQVHESVRDRGRARRDRAVVGGGDPRWTSTGVGLVGVGQHLNGRARVNESVLDQDCLAGSRVLDLGVQLVAWGPTGVEPQDSEAEDHERSSRTNPDDPWRGAMPRPTLAHSPDAVGAVPPRVEYDLTAMGRTLIDPAVALATWAITHQPETAAARQAFDEQ